MYCRTLLLTRIRFILCSLLLATGTVNFVMGNSHLIYLGTYTRTGPSKGIYAVRLDRETGSLSTPELVAEGIDPAWVTLSPDKKHLYTLHGSAAQAIGFSIDSATGKLTPLPIHSPTNHG